MAVRELIAWFEVDQPAVPSIPEIPPIPFACGPRRRRVRWMPMAMKCD
jgi:hypothetical protein